MRHLIASLVFVLAAQAAHAAAPMTSGEYNDALLLAYDPGTGQVSGYFQMERGEQPSFSCIFYLQGKLAGSSAAISTWFPATPKDVIAGTLTLKDAAHVVVRLKEDPGGCPATGESFADASQPAAFDLATAHPWTRIAVVKSAKAYFYDTAGAAAHRKAYVVKGDGVGVRASKPGWVQVDFPGAAAPVTGWLKTSDLF